MAYTISPFFRDLKFLTPSSSATGINSRTRCIRSWPRSDSTIRSRNHSYPGSDARDPSGTPCRYLPVSAPEASGDQVVVTGRYHGDKRVREILRSEWGRLFHNWEKVEPDENGWPDVGKNPARLHPATIDLMGKAVRVLGTCIAEAPEASNLRRRRVVSK